jgi:hypothetical protein
VKSEWYDAQREKCTGAELVGVGYQKERDPDQGNECDKQEEEKKGRKNDSLD